MADDDRPERKEKVLHTRVPEVLEKELKQLAKNLRMPVSNVVRAILEDAVDTVDVVGRKAEGELRGAAARLERVRSKTRRKAARVDESDDDDDGPKAPLEGIVGYQPIVLAQDARCALSGRELQAGEEVYLGIRDGRGPRVLIAKDCLPVSVARATAEQEDEDE